MEAWPGSLATESSQARRRVRGTTQLLAKPEEEPDTGPRGEEPHAVTDVKNSAESLRLGQAGEGTSEIEDSSSETIQSEEQTEERMKKVKEVDRRQQKKQPTYS